VPDSNLSPQLITDGTLKRCSVCGYPFQPDVKPSMSVAFAEHLLKTHPLAKMSTTLAEPIK